MTLEELKVDPRFITLAPSRREFVLAYCTNGADKVAAAKASSDVTTEESAISKANTVLRDPQIRALVNVFYDRTEDIGSLKEALAIIWEEARKNGPDKFKWMSLYCSLRNFKGALPSEQSEPDLYDQVRELEKQEKK